MGGVEKITEGRIGPDSMVRKGTDHLSAVHDDSVVLMSISEGRYFAFDNIGTAIWDILTSPMRVDDLVARLAGMYEAPVEEIRKDVIAFLSRLAEVRLVEID